VSEVCEFKSSVAAGVPVQSTPPTGTIFQDRASTKVGALLYLGFVNSNPAWRQECLSNQLRHRYHIPRQSLDKSRGFVVSEVCEFKSSMMIKVVVSGIMSLKTDAFQANKKPRHYRGLVICWNLITRD
ncbi:TPA: hypothetical protein ACRZ6V_005310, partial [Vibrio harveyi]